MTQEQLLAYLAAASALWPFVGVVVGPVLLIVAHLRPLTVLKPVAVVLTGISIGMLAAR